MLIERNGQHESVFGLVVLAFVLLVGLLAVVAGVDSRIDDVARRRRLGS